MIQKNENFDDDCINIITLGNSAVGKTSFIIKYTDDCFQEVYLSTVGIDYKIKTIDLDDKQYKLFFYDTTGQEKFRALAFNTVKNADGVILMYDITNKESFKSIPEWIKNVRERKGDDFPLILLGNKIDKEDKRVITKEQGEDLAEEYNIDFFEISNKDGNNIDEAIFTFLKKILKYIRHVEGKLSSSVLSYKVIKTKKKKKCC